MHSNATRTKKSTPKVRSYLPIHSTSTTLLLRMKLTVDLDCFPPIVLSRTCSSPYAYLKHPLRHSFTILLDAEDGQSSEYHVVASCRWSPKGRRERLRFCTFCRLLGRLLCIWEEGSCCPEHKRNPCLLRWPSLRCTWGPWRVSLLWTPSLSFILPSSTWLNDLHRLQKWQRASP